MADTATANVGVLNLEVRDNAKEAASGLSELATALESVQRAVGDGLKLAGIVGPLNKLTKNVNDSKSLANIGTFLKSVTSYYNTFKQIGDATKKIEFNTAPIEQLKAAIGEGLHIGKAGTELEKLRISLDKSWNVSASEDVKTVLQNMGEGAAALPTNLGTKAGQLAKFADALREFASASGEVKGAIGHGIVLASTSQFESVGNDAGDGMAKGIQEAKDKVASAAAEMTQAGIESARETQDSHSPAIVYEVEGNNAVDGYVKGIVEKTTWAAGQVAEFIRNCVSAAQGNEEVAAQASAGFTRAFVSSFMGNMDIPEAVKAKMVQASEAIGAVIKNAFASANGNYDQVADAVAALARNTLTGVVNASIGEIKQGFAEASSAKLPADFMPIESATQFKIELQETGNTITSVIIPRFREMYEIWSKMAYAFGMFENETVPKLMAGPDLHRPVAEDQMLSTHVDNWKPDWIFGEGTVRETTAQLEIVSNAMNETEESAKAAREAIKQMFAVKPESFEDVFNGVRHGKKVENDLMSNWLHGNGTKGEQEFALRSMARQFSMTVDEVKAKIAELKAATSSDTGMSKVLSMMDMNKVDLLTAKLNDYVNTTEREYAAGKLSDGQMAERVMTAQRMRDEIMRLSSAEKDAASSASGLDKALSSMKEGMKRAFPTISSLLNRFKQIVKYRMLRTILRQITAGISEGVKNVYYYSQAIGSSFAPSMDAAATSLQQMKNSLGAALAPAIQALIPVLQTVVGWFVTLVNYVNQFFALITGQKTWTRALPAQATAFDDVKKSATGASKAMKDLLADWDELNIIQSESGGGGGSGSGKVTPDYASMFEEVEEFNDTISDIVDKINEKFGDVMGLAKRIGAVLLGWKFSKAFSGLIGTLGSIIAFAGTIDLEFNIISAIDEQFLKSGDEGWLVADVLTTLVGGFIMKKLLDTVLKGNTGYYGMAISLGVSAVAGLKTLLEDTDTTALSPEALELSVLNSLEGGAAAGLLTYESGFTGGFSFGTGVASTLLWLGVNIGLKAVSNVCDTGEITDETRIANLISSGLVGSGFVLEEALVLGKSYMTIRRAAGVGLSSALVTYGVLVGLDAIATTVNTGEITVETIKEDLKSAGFVAGGMMLGEAILGGTIGTIMSAGGYGILTLGALITIEAIIAKQPKRIAWGNKRYTQQQIQQWVDNNMFNSFQLNADMELAANAVTMVDEKKEDLKAKVRELVKQVDALVLGVDVEESAATIDALVHSDDGVIAKFKALQEGKKEQLTLAFSSVKVVDETGSDQSSNLMSVFGEGWDTMNSIMTNLGEQLSAAVKQSYDKSIEADAREMAKKTVVEITQAMMDVSAINLSNQASIDLRNQFTEGMGGIDQSNMQSLLDYFNSQSEGAAKFAEGQFQTILDEAELQWRNYQDLAQKALENGGEFAGYNYNDYIEFAEKFKDMYEKLKEYRKDSIEAAKAFYQEGGEGYQIVRDYMLGLTKDHNVSINRSSYGSNWEETLIPIFNSADSVLNGDKAQQNVNDLFKDFIANAFREEDRATIKSAIDAGVLKYSDFIDKEFINSVADNLGLSGELRQKFNEYAYKLIGLDPKDIDPESVKPIVGKVQESVESGFEGESFLTDEALQNVADSAKDAAEKVIDTAKTTWDYFMLANDSIVDDNTVIEPMVYIDPDVELNDGALESVKEQIRKAAEDELDELINGGSSSESRSFGSKSGNPLARIRELAKEHLANQNSRYIPNANISGQDYAAIPTQIKIEPQITESDIANGVATGTARGNEEQNVLLREAVNYLLRIANKNFTVNVNPSSAWSRTNNASDAMFTKVTG